MLRSRVLTAAVLVAILLAALFWLPFPGWSLFAGGFLALAAWEWGALATPRAGVAYPASILALGAAALWLEGPVPWLSRACYWGAAVFWILVAPLWLGRWRCPPPWARLVAGVVVLVPAFLAIVELRERGAWTLIGVMALVWISDTSAYLAGTQFGRHQLAPAISPGKTWEGVAGALAAAALYAAALAFGPAELPAPPAVVVALGLALAVVGIVGDLFESQMKRAAGVKDSGRFLPGHGGMLDRTDALIAVMPLAALLLVP